ncbi:hypothetical protein GALMADRAFT_228198 [Galerina marginata CBS 339.88]|uniref:Cobalamin-independent methionine synthase MetE C-terminal/archaeal domain-containing protein n=1 Tax=Galerina marginata (strain CBS 339.88) TaxID=685588 RepID=A0A067SS80_GALM3|nr:hypothetical protein GALMADRAFT_228198 [Galerina marginata CBS 339.88]
MTSSASSTLHLNPPYRADHIGSLLRPKALHQKRQDLQEGKCSKEDLKEAEDESVKHVLKLQREVGIKNVTDGEMRRGFFWDGIFEKMDGMTYMPRRPITDSKWYNPEIKLLTSMGVDHEETVFCTGKIKRTKPFYVDDFKYAKALVPPEDVKFIKVTMVSPIWMHRRHGSDKTYDLSVYSNDEEYFDDIGKAFREEVKDLYDLGCRHIQIDDPNFCFLCSEEVIGDMQTAGVDNEAVLDTYIRAVNRVTQDRPANLTMSLHMCRGNLNIGRNFTEGGYGRIAAKAFNLIDVDAFYLEYDSEGAGDFQPLKHFPLGKVAVLGLVTTKSAKLESPEVLKARVHEAAKVMSEGNPNRTMEMALNQLCLSPQCGFASVWAGNALSEEDEIKKLKLVIDTAKDIWPDA